MNNTRKKKIIQAFTDLTEGFKIRGINPGFHFMDNEASTALKMTMKNYVHQVPVISPK